MAFLVVNAKTHARATAETTHAKENVLEANATARAASSPPYVRSRVARAMPDDATITLGVVGCAAGKAKTARQALLLVSQTVGENAAAVRAMREELAEARLSARLLSELHMETKSPNSLLLYAVTHDLADVARHALRVGANKDVTDDKVDVDDQDDYYHIDVDEVRAKNTALIIAARRGSIRCLRLLLEAGANRFRANRAGDTPLSAAAQTGQGDCLRALIETKSDDIRWDSAYARQESETLLLLAAESGSAECVRILLEAGVFKIRPFPWSEFNIDPLLGAVKRGHVDCVQVLLEALAEAASVTDQRDQAKDAVQTAALFASSRGKTDCLRLLIKAGADPEQLP